MLVQSTEHMLEVARVHKNVRAVENHFPPKNKKKFISKKNAVTFQVVHRSQQDPLVADENAPQHVLKECSRKKNKEEEHKYGIFFDDEYDYMQHLKSVADIHTEWDQINYKEKSSSGTKKSLKGNVLLPSSVFESEIEESVGLLNKAAPIYGPRPELDPDIVAAMDDDFDFDDPDNILEDNFVELANKGGSDASEDESDFGSEYEDEVGSLDSPEEFGEVETKSRFTDYSMTSSVIRRNEQLTLLDDRFENMFKAYDESEIGSLPCEGIEGVVSAQDEQLIKLAEESLKNDEFDLNVKERTLLEANKQESSDEELQELVIKEPEKWDCESILSTYSNIYNHPAKICEPKDPSKIRISKKTGLPMNVLGTSKLTAHNLSLLNNCEKPSGPKSIISQISELSIRSKNETPEERRKRKTLLKEYRRERRIERKANTQAFKEEKLRQEKIMLNVKNNQMGIKIF